MRKTESLTLRLSADFKKKLFEEAKRENRSVTNYLETTLTELWKGAIGKRTIGKKGQ